MKSALRLFYIQHIPTFIVLTYGICLLLSTTIKTRYHMSTYVHEKSKSCKSGNVNMLIAEVGVVETFISFYKSL